MTENRIAICIANFGVGGAQRAMLTLAKKMIAVGWTVDFIVFRSTGAYLRELPPQSTVYCISEWLPLQFVGLRRYSKRHPNAVFLTAQTRVSRVVGLFRKLVGLPHPFIIREPNRIGTRKSSGWNRIWKPIMPWLYNGANGFVTLSVAARKDLASLVNRDADDLPLIPNALNQAHVEMKGKEPLDHPWLLPGRDCPVVLGVGRLVEQKGFDVLIAAVAQVRRDQRVRLMILGQGPLRSKLIAQAEAAGLGQDIFFAGFQENPFAYMSRANIFALTSRWEGSPNVLLEAMATGTPVVACDCPSGPREILVDKSLGTLVAVDDVDALTTAIINVLKVPGNASKRIDHIRNNHGTREWSAAYIKVIEDVMK